MISKLVAGREKDLAFADALIRAAIVEVSVLRERAEMLDDVHPVALERLRNFLRRYAEAG